MPTARVLHAHYTIGQQQLVALCITPAANLPLEQQFVCNTLPRPFDLFIPIWFTLPTIPFRCFYSLPPCYSATLQAPARLTFCRCLWAPPRPAGGMWVCSAPWRRQVHQWPSVCLVMAAGWRLRVPPPCPAACAVPVAGRGEE